MTFALRAINISSLFLAWSEHVMLERNFQSQLIKDIKHLFPGCLVLKNDPDYIQGIPDLLVLHNDRWAALEVKRSHNAKHRPNQDYYVKKMNDMSYAAFICPENKEEILNELQRSFKACGKTCSSKSKRV